MGVRVDPRLVDWERMAETTRKVIVDPCFLDWSKVAALARIEGKTLEQVLGVQPVRPITEPEGLEERFNELVNEMAAKSGKTRKQFLEDSKKHAGSYEAALIRADRLGVDVSQLFTIDYILIGYGDTDYSEILPLLNLQGGLTRE